MYNRALRLIRAFHHMTQNDLATKLGLSKSYISELEQGHKTPSIDVLEKYATFFRIPLSSLMLFAEKVESGGIAEDSRVAVADKVLKMLDWITTISDTQETEE
jgi:transcriptional regulator with XRE-family HTH domain